MASISFVEGKWRALIRRKGYASISKRFDTKAKAMAWARDIEGQILTGVVPQNLPGGDTVADLIKKYREMRAKTRPILDTSTEHYTLRQLTSNLGALVVARMTVDDLMGWALARKDEGAGPYTVNCDLSKLGTVIRYTTTGLPDVIGAARPKLAYLGLIGGGGLRERRPTEDEYQSLLDHFREKHGEKYAQALEFAAVTAMRRGEICAIEFDDVDKSKRLVQVWRKHPRKGKTLERVPLLGRAWDIVKARKQEQDDARIFPIHPQTLSKYFTEACRSLSIPDLHFHDFRHEGTSALFEAGYPIEKVALVTGHKSWANLKRYTNLKPESIHEHDPDTTRGHDSRKIVSLRPRKSAP